MAALQDRKILSQAKTEKIQSVQLNIQESLPAIGKLVLMKNANQGNVIEISEEDASMSKNEVEGFVSQALQSCYEAGFFSLFENGYSEYRPLLVWDSQNTMLCGIVWEWRIVGTQDDFQEILFLVDDETGSILRIHYWGNDVVGESQQEEVLSTFIRKYFTDLQITDFRKFETDDLEKEYIGDNVQGTRYRFWDEVYGEVNVDFFVSKSGFYMEFPNLDEKGQSK